MTGETPRQDPQISAILFDYYARADMKWATSQEALEGSLGEEALAMGDLLLTTEEPLTLAEIREQLDLSKADLDKAYRRLSLFMPLDGPLALRTSLRPEDESPVSRFQIVPVPPKEQAEL
jgi:hypothetical protein